MAPESKTQVTTANEDISSEYPSVIGLFIPRTNKTKPYTPASSFRAHPTPPQLQTKSQVLPQLQTKSRVTSQLQTKARVLPQLQTKSRLLPQIQTKSRVPSKSQSKPQVLPQLQTKPRTGKVKNFYPEAACTLLIITQD